MRCTRFRLLANNLLVGVVIGAGVGTTACSRPTPMPAGCTLLDPMAGERAYVCPGRTTAELKQLDEWATSFVGEPATLTETKWQKEYDGPNGKVVIFDRGQRKQEFMEGWSTGPSGEMYVGLEAK